MILEKMLVCLKRRQCFKLKFLNFTSGMKLRLLNNTTFPDNNKFLNTRPDMWCNIYTLNISDSVVFN